jgi:hypothetical protein
LLPPAVEAIHANLMRHFNSFLSPLAASSLIKTDLSLDIVVI